MNKGFYHAFMHARVSVYYAVEIEAVEIIMFYEYS